MLFRDHRFCFVLFFGACSKTRNNETKRVKRNRRNHRKERSETTEIKLSQFADNTNLFCADVASAEQSLKTMSAFENFSGLVLNVEKTKAFWLGKWLNNRTKPLGMKWMNTPTKLLGIYVSYDEKGNNQMNFNLKVQKLQTNLDIWKSRGLTLYGKVLIIKSLGLSLKMWILFIVV